MRHILGQTGLVLSPISLGASSLGGGVFGPVEEKDAIRTVHVAIDNGVRLIDVAPFYGQTRAETVLGKALRGVRRDRYVIATKVGRYERQNSTSPESECNGAWTKACNVWEWSMSI